ncbi:3-phosphoinositide-dependent protein kinase 1-like isoform X1 [Asterias rubens]|uniref:3-phosphoinositide-dependent protein kinase 1-like isoform X1 n=1 Tax=Asterias rubens TaxID=7604 RepID=UPI001455D4A9|nr:3-phosphoinositide-dependent protein kinase 1-like isoform X1 [Asterias rubens]
MSPSGTPPSHVVVVEPARAKLGCTLTSCLCGHSEVNNSRNNHKNRLSGRLNRMLTIAFRRWTSKTKKSKEQARQPIGGSDSSSCDTSSTNGHQQRQHIKSPASRTVSTGTTTNCKRGSTPPSSSPSQPLSSSLPSTSSDYLQKRPSEVSSSPKDMNPAQQQAETTTSTTTAPKKKQRADFKFGKILGEGSYSEVVLATEIATGNQYAIKVLVKRHIFREKKEKYVMREREVLSKLDHPFFVKLYFTFQDKDKLYFGLSLAKKGELLPYIQKLGSFDENATRFYAAEVVLALEYLHNMGIIHRDLKPENILLNEDMHIQITDFGTVKILDENAKEVRANSFVGTAQYVSPELLTEKSAMKSSDLWALGCLIYQLLAGLPPFRASNEYMIFQKIIKLEYEFPEGFPERAKDLVSRLLVLDPLKRIGCEDCGGFPELKAHPFFEGTKWDNICNETPPALKPCMVVDGEEIHSDFYIDEFDLTPLNKFLSKIQPEENNRQRDLNKPKYVIQFTKEERAARLEKQRRENKWHRFVEGNLVLKMGLIDKRRGLFARRRQFLLTEGPHLYYIDPENMVLKGEIPWSQHMRVEVKTFKTFFVHTPNRLYYLIDPDGHALEWCSAIEEMYRHTFETNQKQE